jgi:eukaryotic-like serine/threonine-protein kinase
MALSTGSQIGPYQILAPLGSGGMGDVYRATDPRLRREVAVKVLPDAVATDPQRMARFAREAQLLAALNHPNIAAIYGFEESSNTHALVMELVEGLTLAERIKMGPIPLDEALPIARQIAEALEYAHERGIVHRDLKPANVKITPHGTVKVLDFGLAKALSEDPTSSDSANSPTLTAAATKAGLILGTAAYMSPEQARGRTVDRRADIWSFGAVLYEMLTGNMAFKGDTVSDTLASVIKSEPDWSALPPRLPSGIRQLLFRCLHKEAKQRLQSIGEARIAIENAMAGGASVVVSMSDTILTPSPAVNRTVTWFAGASLGLLLLALGFVLAKIATRTAAPAASSVIRFAITPPPGTTIGSMGRRAIAISPDGMRIAFRANSPDGQRLYLREMNSATATPISGTDGAFDPFFSPDGKWLAFYSSGKLKKLAVNGGTPQPLASELTENYGTTWGADQFIYYAPTLASGIMRVPADGGAPQPVTKVQSDKGEIGHICPQLLPGEKTVLFTVWMGGSMDDGPLVAQRLDTGERKTLVANGFAARFVAPNHLLYIRSGNLMVVEFDPVKLTLTGTPVSVIQDVALHAGVGGAQFDVSPNGTLVYINGGKQTTENRLIWAVHDAKPEPLPVKPNLYQSPRFSPNGKELALTARLPDPDIWIYDIDRGALRRITFATGEDEVPVWSPDGKRLAYSSNSRQQAFVTAIDGSGQEESVLKNESHFHLQSWSPDGKLIAYEREASSGQWEIWMLPMEADHKPYPYLQSPFRQSHPAFSPDGHWLAYDSNESDRSEVYVQRFPGRGDKVQVSTDGGHSPVWSHDGRLLVYENSGTLWAVEISASPSFRAGKSRVLYQGDIWDDAAGPNFALAPDGKHLAVVERAKDPYSGNINVVLNWQDELQRLSGAEKK